MRTNFGLIWTQLQFSQSDFFNLKKHIFLKHFIKQYNQHVSITPQKLMLFISRHEQAATLYQNIGLTEPRLIPQFEKVIINFTKEIKQQNSEMENLALAVKR